MEAADRLGYRPNVVAKSLRRKETRMIGLVVPDLQNPFFPGLVAAVENELDVQGYELLLCESRSDPQIEARRVQALIDRQVDGVILSPFHEVGSAAAVQLCATSGTRLVLLDRAVSGAAVPWVGLDDGQGMATAVQHLVASGCRTLAFVSAGSESSSGRARLAGFRTAAAAAGAVITDVLLGEFSTEWGVEASGALGTTPDGVVCGNDSIALGVVRGLHQRGLRVPADVQVIGCDDTPVAQWSDPALTTLRQPTAAMARACLEAFFSPAEGNLPDRAIAPTLIVRDSTRHLPDSTGESADG
jgi:LacI family transcriptional regulator